MNPYSMQLRDAYYSQKLSSSDHLSQASEEEDPYSVELFNGVDLVLRTAHDISTVIAEIQSNPIALALYEMSSLSLYTEGLALGILTEKAIQGYLLLFKLEKWKTIKYSLSNSFLRIKGKGETIHAIDKIGVFRKKV